MQNRFQADSLLDAGSMKQRDGSTNPATAAQHVIDVCGVAGARYAKQGT